jgi:ferredoxin
MDAMRVAETAEVDRERCIGCGLCVPACPAEAISLRQKAEAERYVPPRNVYETYRNMACERDGHSG